MGPPLRLVSYHPPPSVRHLQAPTLAAEGYGRSTPAFFLTISKGAGPKGAVFMLADYLLHLLELHLFKS